MMKNLIQSLCVAFGVLGLMAVMAGSPVMVIDGLPGSRVYVYSTNVYGIVTSSVNQAMITPTISGGTISGAVISASTLTNNTSYKLPGYVSIGGATSNSVDVAITGDISLSAAGVVAAVGTNAFSVQFTNLSGATNTLVFTNGILKKVTAP